MIHTDLRKVGIEVDEKDVLFVQRINGATIVRLRDGSLLTAPAVHQPRNFGECILLDHAMGWQNSPLFDPSKPLGLKLPGR